MTRAPCPVFRPHVLLLAAGLLLPPATGCSPAGDDEPRDDTPEDTDQADTGEPDTGEPDTGEPDTGEPDTGEPDTGEPSGSGRPMVAARRVTSEITWQIDFDATAEAAGYADCSYTRTFTGVQFLDQPYLCPDCDQMFRVEATITSGHGDCYEPVFGGPVEQDEVWGVSGLAGEADPVGFYRTTRENLSMGLLTTADSGGEGAPFSIGWDATYSTSDLGLDGDGQATLAAAGTVLVEEDPHTLIEDLGVSRTNPYGCLWPLDGPGDLDTTWRLEQDKVIPTAWLEDPCGELVDLWDFHGSYLVLDSSQPDCGYCLQMAEAVPDLLETMAGHGVEVRFITLLGESLRSVNQPPSDEDWASFLDRYQDTEPILKDRGYGYATIGSYLGDDLGYPAWAVVRPDMTLLGVGVGFGGWDAIESMILDDLGE